ncbi:unnamed protein product [Timema podura]|uniref:Uncharacterized protein n=1 Tax=Timema podura TaxID=61482 RepID=A0ABN7NWU6_TIMPD|nr:unnamed protein product [Timema podura]
MSGAKALRLASPIYNPGNIFMAFLGQLLNTNPFELCHRNIHSTTIRAISEILVSNKTNITVKIEPHKFLTVCKGVVTCFDLNCVSIELDTQHVTKVYRIATKRNSTVKTIDTYIFTFTNPTPPKEVEQGSLCSGSGCMSPIIGVVFSVRSLVISSCNAVVSQPVQEVHNTLCESPKFCVNYKASCVSHCHLQGVKEFTVDRAMAGVHYIPVHDVIELMAALHLVHSFINKNGKTSEALLHTPPLTDQHCPESTQGEWVCMHPTLSSSEGVCTPPFSQMQSTQLLLSLSYFTTPYCAKILLPPPHHPSVP